MVRGGRYAIVTETKIHESDDGLVAEYQYELADPNHTPVLVTYHVNSDMRMQLTVEYPGNATDMASLPAFGIEWELPGEYDRLRYYGPGPEETYRDRKQGGKLGIWDDTAKASMAPPAPASSENEDEGPLNRPCYTSSFQEAKLGGTECSA